MGSISVTRGANHVASLVLRGNHLFKSFANQISIQDSCFIKSPYLVVMVCMSLRLLVRRLYSLKVLCLKMKVSGAFVKIVIHFRLMIKPYYCFSPFVWVPSLIRSISNVSDMKDDKCKINLSSFDN